VTPMIRGVTELTGDVDRAASHQWSDRGAVTSMTGQAATTPSPHTDGFFAGVADKVSAKSGYRWLLVVTGFAWIVVAVAILRITYETVAAVALLFGGICVVVAATEVFMGAMSSRRWRIVHWLLAVLFVVVGVMAFLAMKATLAVLAAVMSFFFISRGAIDVVSAMAAIREHGWQLLLMVGMGELALGLWAAGPWKASFPALMAWIAAGTVLHGVGQIASGFLMRGVGHDVATRGA
jgi:uncharacterized membrane protein HdeD (DUF308 family)